MAKVPTSLAKSLGPNQSNMLSLVHSAVDISDELYNFAQWLNQEQFLLTPRINKNDVVQDQPDIQMRHPLAFDNYNYNNQNQGFGLKTIHAISQNSDILKFKTKLGLLSDSLVDDTTGDAENELFDALTANTRKVANMCSPHNKALANRMNNHFTLA